MKIYSKHLHSQTVRARELKFSEKVHLPPPVTCHVSHVTYHMSHVACHVSHVKCNFFSFFFQSGEACLWRVCYQWGLPRLVFWKKGHYLTKIQICPDELDKNLFFNAIFRHFFVISELARPPNHLCQPMSAFA